MHFWTLCQGALPIFVAATITEAMESLFHLITDNFHAEVGLMFVYALFVAQLVAYFVIYKVSPAIVSFFFDYLFFLYNIFDAYNVSYMFLFNFNFSHHMVIIIKLVLNVVLLHGKKV